MASILLVTDLSDATLLHRLWSLAASFPRQRVFATVGEGCPAAWETAGDIAVASSDETVDGPAAAPAPRPHVLGARAPRTAGIHSI